MTNNTIENPVAFLIVKKGLSSLEISEATAKVVQLWGQIGLSYGHTVLSKAKSFEYLQNNVKKRVPLPSEEACTEGLNTLMNVTASWQIANNAMESIELEEEQYTSVTNACKNLEQRLNLTGANLVVMNYNEGVCFIAPTYVDSSVHEQFKKIIFG